MKSLTRKFFLALFLAALVLNPLSVAGSMVQSVKKSEQFAELERILGKGVIICTNSNAKKMFYSSFERLDIEKHQKLKKEIDLATSAVHSDSNYFINVYFGLVDALHKGAIKPDTATEQFAEFHLQNISSRAPPSFS